MAQVKDLGKIMAAYTRWAQLVHQHQHSDDVLDRTAVLSSRACVRQLMETLRGAVEDSKGEELLQGATEREGGASPRDGEASRDPVAPDAPAGQAVTPAQVQRPSSALPPEAAPQVDDRDIAAAEAALQDDFGAIFEEEEAMAAEMWGDDGF